MKRGRPEDPNSIYRVSKHRNGGHTYAATHVYTIGEDGKRRYRYMQWGKLEGDRFLPGPTYFYADPEERKRLIFPPEWDTSEIDRLSTNRGPGRPAFPHAGDRVRLAGHTWLLGRISEKIGLTEDLLKVFGGDAEMVKDVLSVAVYPPLSDKSYNRMARWQDVEKAFTDRVMDSKAITLLTQSIGESHRAELLRLRAARMGKGEVCAVDSTSRSSWFGCLADVKYGHSKDGSNRPNLPQTTEVVAYSLTSHMPVFYKTFPGNIPDSRTIPDILRDMESFGFDDVVLVTDRGYNSLQNLETYILKGLKTIAAVSTSQKFVKDRIRELGAIDGSPAGMDLDLDSELYTRQYRIGYEVAGIRGGTHEADMRLNLYLNPVNRAAALLDIDYAVASQQRELEALVKSGAPADDEKTMKGLFGWFDVKYREVEAPGGGGHGKGDAAEADGGEGEGAGKVKVVESFARRDGRIAEARALAGFFANVTTGMDMAPAAAHSSYCLRDEQEKYFSSYKGPMRARSQQNWSEDGKTGRLFIQFVGLIIFSWLRWVFKSDDRLNKRFSSSLEVIDAMRCIRCVERDGKEPRLEPFVGDQLTICEAFGVQVPDGCAPKYKSARKVEKKRRGRPRKKK